MDQANFTVSIICPAINLSSGNPEACNAGSLAHAESFGNTGSAENAGNHEASNSVGNPGSAKLAVSHEASNSVGNPRSAKLAGSPKASGGAGNPGTADNSDTDEYYEAFDVTQGLLEAEKSEFLQVPETDIRFVNQG